MVLRPLEMSDVDTLMDIFSDPEAMRYYPGTKCRSDAEDREDLDFLGYSHAVDPFRLSRAQRLPSLSSRSRRQRSSRSFMLASAPRSFGS